MTPRIPQQEVDVNANITCGVISPASHEPRNVFEGGVKGILECTNSSLACCVPDISGMAARLQG